MGEGDISMDGDVCLIAEGSFTQPWLYHYFYYFVLLRVSGAQWTGGSITFWIHIWLQMPSH